jgi:hypothetical protein
MTWEYQGPFLVRNVRTYQTKVDMLQSGYRIESRERDGRLEEHQKFLRMHPDGRLLVPEEGAFNATTEGNFYSETMVDRIRGWFR